MSYNLKTLLTLFILILLALAALKIISGLVSILLPAAIVIIAAYIIYRIIKRR